MYEINGSSMSMEVIMYQCSSKTFTIYVYIYIYIGIMNHTSNKPNWFVVIFLIYFSDIDKQPPPD